MTKQTQEALKMAIEALEFIKDGGFYTGEDDCIQACKEALEQPEQEPVAWMELKEDAGYIDITVWQEPVSKKSIPLYTHPAPQPTQMYQQIPDGTLKALDIFAPSWQGLSDDERFIIVQNADWDNPYDIAELIEQALKEKNNAM